MKKLNTNKNETVILDNDEQMVIKIDNSPIVLLYNKN